MSNKLTLKEASEYMSYDTGQSRWKKKVESGEAVKLLAAANAHYENFHGNFAGDPNMVKSFIATILFDLLRNKDVNSMRYKERLYSDLPYMPNLYTSSDSPFFPFVK